MRPTAHPARRRARLERGHARRPPRPGPGRSPAFGVPWSPRPEGGREPAGPLGGARARLEALRAWRPKLGASRRQKAGSAEETYSPYVPVLVAVVGVLCMIGLVMVLSASSVDALRQYGTPWYFFKRQLVWLAVGAGAMFLCARRDYHSWARVARPLLVVCLILLLAVLVPGLGLASGGSARWVGVGQLRVQPSELMKLALVLFGADLVSRRARRRGQWEATTRPIVVVFCLAAALIMRQPDMGTTLVLACIAATLLFCSGTPLATLAKLGGGLVAAAVVLGLAQPYRRARLLSFLHPFSHSSGSGYQVVQSLFGLGRGHLIGVGLGASRAKWGFLPNAHTDFIFSILGEEMGLVGGLLVILLFAGLAVLGVRIALRARDPMGSLLAVGTTAWVVSQAAINIGAVTGILPVTGVPLPLVSYGGSSLVILMAALGMLVNVASSSHRGARPPA
jgi:cell division protein FtsW